LNGGKRGDQLYTCCNKVSEWKFWLYGNGFGQTNPPITAGLAVQQGVLPDNPTVTIGGIAANVIYAAVVSPGLYQFNVVVPAIAPPGDLPLLATYNGVSTQPGVVIAVSQ
jgi:uncharacterized protein (TIGR03437 family)